MRSFPVRPALTILTFAILLAIAPRLRSGLAGPTPALFASLVPARAAARRDTLEGLRYE